MTKIYSFSTLDLPGTRAPFEIEQGTITLIETDHVGLKRVLDFFKGNNSLEMLEGELLQTLPVNNCCEIHIPGKSQSSGFFKRLFKSKGKTQELGHYFDLEIKTSGTRSAGEVRVSSLMEILSAEKECFVLINPFNNVDVIVKRKILKGLKKFAEQRGVSILIISEDETVHDILNPDNYMILKKEN